MSSSPPLIQRKQPSVINYLQYLPFIPSLIQAAESIHGAGTGPQKKAAVLGAFSFLVGAAEPLVFAANPGYAALGPIVDAVVDELKQAGQMPVQAPPQVVGLIAPFPVPSGAPASASASLTP